MSDTASVASLLERRLRQLGVSRVYGAALGGLEHIPVEDPDIAVLLADADGRIGHWDGSGRLGAALLEGPILHLSSCREVWHRFRRSNRPRRSSMPSWTLPGWFCPAPSLSTWTWTWTNWCRSKVQHESRFACP